MCTWCMYTVYIYQVYRCPDVLGAPVGTRCVPGVCAQCIYTRCTGVPMYWVHQWVRDAYQVNVHGVYIPGVLGVQMYWVHQWVRDVYQVYVHGVRGVNTIKCECVNKTTTIRARRMFIS